MQLTPKMSACEVKAVSQRHEPIQDHGVQEFGFGDRGLDGGAVYWASGIQIEGERNEHETQEVCKWRGLWDERIERRTTLGLR